jgi:urease accessory protein
VNTTTETGWRGRLDLRYWRDDHGRTLAHDRHEGPLRVLRRLYPEGPGICHHVVVHPPGGIVGGDRIEIHVALEAGAHALVTTPGATRFYRSAGPEASQDCAVRLAAGARLEWLPLEAIAYDGCLARNRIDLTLDAGAEALGWDVVALGLPEAGQAFERGVFEQSLALAGAWLERGRIAGNDERLLASPLGLAGHRVLATAWFAAGSDLAPSRREALLDAARDIAQGDAALAATAGCTAPHARVVVLRVLADRVEPAMTLLAAVRAAWRRAAWGLAAHTPRIWRT